MRLPLVPVLWDTLYTDPYIYIFKCADMVNLPRLDAVLGEPYEELEDSKEVDGDSNKAVGDPTELRDPFFIFGA